MIFLNLKIIKLNLFLLIVTLLLAACKQNEPKIEDELIKIKTSHISGVDIKLNNDTVLWNPLGITVFDTLAVFEDQSKSTAFSLINLTNGRLIKRFGYSGKGPGEMDILAVNLRRTQQMNTFVLYEANAPYRLFKYNLDSLVLVQRYKPESFCTLSPNYHFNDATIFNDSIIIGAFGGYKSYLYGTLNCNNRSFSVQNLITFPEEYNSGDYKKFMMQVLNGKTVINPFYNKICYFSYKGLILDISEIKNNNKLKSIFFKKYYFPSFFIDSRKYTRSVILKSGCRMGFNDVDANKDRIYSLFNGQQITKGNNQFLFSNTILVYDWDGNLLESIKMDKTYSHISVDPYNPNVIYGMHTYDSIYITKFFLNERY